MKIFPKKFYRLKYTIFEILAHIYISPHDFFRVVLLIIKDKKIHKKENDVTKYFFEFDNKKTIIVVDDQIPEFDNSAGDRTLFQYIELYIDMGFSVKFIPDDFTRREPYTFFLEKMGVEVLYGKYCKQHYEDWICKNADKIDFVMLNAPRSIKYIDLFKKYTKAKILYYGMDMYFVREFSMYLVHQKRKNLIASKYYKKIEMLLYRKSDILLTISSKEAKEMSSLTKNKIIYVMPCFFYRDFTSSEYNFNIRNDLIFVGGERELANKDGIQWFCEYIFPQILLKNNDMKIFIVGYYEKSFINKYSSNNIIFKGNISDKELELLYSSVRISIAPLRFGAGVKGKVVEALCNGVPMISTDYGIEGIPDVESIIAVANDEKSFTDTLISIYDNQKYLENISNLSLKFAKEHFSYQCAFNLMSKLLDTSK
ncbi:MAG: glycosyltransferase [Endomicrobiaceae bacterium]|nr:glycosyltransferase [Endomicrobiaceae bacterium]